MLKHRNIKGLFFISLLVIVGLFFLGKKSEGPEVTVQTDPDLIKVTELVHQIWNGDRVERYLSDNDFLCPSVKVGQWQQLPKDYFKCNFELLNCALKYEFDTRVDLKNLKIQPLLPIQKKLDQEAGPYGLVGFTFQASGHHHPLKIKLEPRCHQIVLPKGKYEAGIGAEFGSPKQVYEVMNTIKVDRRLFDYGKLKYLKELNPKELNHIEIPSHRHWYTPVENLNAKQMEKVCRVNGQEIMRSEYLDAVSFVPKKLKGKHQNEFKAPYIFGHNSELKSSLEGKPCDSIAAKECPKENFIFSPHFSWVGVTQLHGGLMEYAPAMFQQERSGNVWPSSWHFASESIMQKIGVRIKWEGENLMRKSFDFSQIKDFAEADIPEKLSIGFRCIKVLP